MAKRQQNTALPEYAVINNFIQKCPRKRGVAVFTRGLNLNINGNQLTSAAWPANPRRIAVGDCFIVYHRTGPGQHYPAVIYTGIITAIIPLANGLNRYEVVNVHATHMQGVSWVQFSGSQSRIRYFP